MTDSQNGWPGLKGDSRFLHIWHVPGESGMTTLRLRNGSAGFLLCHLALFFDDKVEALRGAILDDWGYAYRPVRGFSTLSNHASGTAMDLDAVDHPLGVVGTFADGEVAALHKVLAKRYQGTIRWGGDYRNRKDEMHFELDRDLPTCEKLARSLMRTKRGKQLLDANPTQKAVILS